jgi:hypothetical protein
MITMRVTPFEKTLIDSLSCGIRGTKSEILRGIILNAALELHPNTTAPDPTQLSNQNESSLEPAGDH